MRNAKMNVQQITIGEHVNENMIQRFVNLKTYIRMLQVRSFERVVDGRGSLKFCYVLLFSNIKNLKDFWTITRIKNAREFCPFFAETLSAAET